MSKFELYSPQVEDIHTLKQNGVAKILFGQYEGDWNGQYDSKGKLFFCPGFERTREEGLRLILDRQLSPSVLGRSVFCESKLAYAIANGCLSYRDLGIWQEHLFLRIMLKFVILSSQHREAETVGGLPSRRRVFSHDYIFRIVSILFIARRCHQSGNSDWT